MELSTKFNPKDTIWFMKNNKPINDQVLMIRIEISSLGSITTLYFYGCGQNDFMHTREVFATKAELLESL